MKMKINNSMIGEIQNAAYKLNLNFPYDVDYEEEAIFLLLLAAIHKIVDLENAIHKIAEKVDEIDNSHP